MLRLHVNPFDYTILGIYFALVVTIAVMARRAVATSEDFLLFDLRVLIGGLFLVYGIMLVIAVFFLAWWRLRPLRRDQPPPAATGTGP